MDQEIEEMRRSLQALRDEAAIRQTVQNWALWRDTGAWEQLRSCYAPGALVQTTWMSGTLRGPYTGPGYPRGNSRRTPQLRQSDGIFRGPCG